MATKQEVKIYLAHWFQLGKTVVLNRDNVIFSPKKVITGNSYSQEFEECWQQIISSKTGDCCLEGTHQTIQELLTPAWEIVNCSRCDMPLAMHSIGMPAAICPCHYLTNWPNTEVPSPRCPIDSQIYLQQIRDRLIEKSETSSC